ncbi:MAG TPA: hypothetical protein PKY59_22460, partial [Pyrinomonadaceae bacterium]|nr:hypothetical protein [Pyrinomonadaceae bacterium]
MKNFLVSMVIMFVFAVTLPLTADAQTCRGRSYRRSNNVSRNYRAANRGYANRGYYQTRGYSYQRPSFYRRHRNLINVGIGTGAGALIGGLLGGRRGVGIGALVGAGSGAAYTYGIRPKKRR